MNVKIDPLLEQVPESVTAASFTAVQDRPLKEKSVLNISYNVYDVAGTIEFFQFTTQVAVYAAL